MHKEVGKYEKVSESTWPSKSFALLECVLASLKASWRPWVHGSGGFMLQ